MGKKKEKIEKATTPNPILDLLTRVVDRLDATDKKVEALIKEVQDVKKSPGRDGHVGTEPVQSIRETGQAADVIYKGVGADGAGRPGEVGRVSSVTEKVKERALQEGQAGAVSSFTPSGEPEPGWLPPPANIKKVLFPVGEAVPCQECKKPVYEVVKEVNTHTKLNELVDCLRPYSPEVPLLTAETQVRKINAALNCPLCLKEWGVLLYAKA